MSDDRKPFTRVRVWRDGIGPLPGIRRGTVAAYEFDVAPRFVMRTPTPAHPLRQRAFVLIDQQIQLNQPVVSPNLTAAGGTQT